MKTVFFACVHNAGRSQIAAAFFNSLADPGVARAVSAGTRPADRVHPEVVAVMREVGIDLSAAKPRLLTAELAAGASLLVTMGCGDECRWSQGCAGTIGRSRIRRASRRSECAKSATRCAGESRFW